MKENIDEVDDAVVGKRIKELYNAIRNKPVGTHNYYSEATSVMEGALGDEENFKEELGMIEYTQNHYKKFCEEMGISYKGDNYE